MHETHLQPLHAMGIVKFKRPLVEKELHISHSIDMTVGIYAVIVCWLLPDVYVGDFLKT